MIGPLRWVVLAAGEWLLLAPWLLGCGTKQTAESLAVGFLLVVFALLGGKAGKSFGGGWRMLLKDGARKKQRGHEP